MDLRCRFQVLAKPRAKRSQIVAARPGTLEIALAAPPVDGAANDELIRFLAERLGIAKSRVELVRGAGGRHKLVQIDGLAEAEVLARLQDDTG